LKFKNYLIEIEKKDQPLEHIRNKTIIEMLEKDCKQFLKESRGTFIWRGVKNLQSKMGGKDYIKIKPRINRQPTDTPLYIHKYVDKVFKEKFGWPARSEGVFVTGEKARARYFGELASVWPIGSFKFVWSPSVRDFTVDMPTDLVDYESMDELPVGAEIDLIEILESYTNKDLLQAIRMNKEIMIKCKEYYLIPSWISTDPSFGVFRGSQFVLKDYA